MSFVITAPEMVTAAAANLAGIGSTLGEATAAAAGPTTSVAAAAADEVSTALSQLFGTYGHQFQALSARAAAFHTEFVNLMNSGATAYLTTEIANAQQALAAPTAAAVTDPILGGLSPILGGGTGGGILGGVSPILGGLTAPLSLPNLSPVFSGVGQEVGAAVSALISGNPSALLSGLSAASSTASQAGGPWQVLFANTSANLQNIFNGWAAHPFPVVQQVIINQNGYAQSVGSGLATALQNFPTTMANVPTNIQLGIQGASTFPSAAQTFINQQNSYNQTLNAALMQAGAGLQQRLPIFENDLGIAGQEVMAGNYHGAVHEIPQAVVDLLISGVSINISPLNILNGANLNNLITFQVQGPAEALLAVSAVSAEQQQSFVNLLPAGSIPQQIAQNFLNAVNTATGSLAFGIIGPPITTLDGLATGATMLGTALQTGNGVAAVGALVDMPAYVLNGYLNGDTVVDLTIPLTETINLPLLPPIVAGTPIVIGLPFEGILVQPQPITVSIDFPVVVTTIPLSFTLTDTQFGGLVPELLDYAPQQIASAIAPK
jgi:PE family